MKQVIKNILDSFDNTTQGYSSRKLTAFIVSLLVVASHIKWITLGDLQNLESVLTIDFTFIATLFGITTYSSVKSKKNDSENKNQSNK